MRAVEEYNDAENAVYVRRAALLRRRYKSELLREDMVRPLLIYAWCAAVSGRKGVAFRVAVCENWQPVFRGR